MKSKIIISIIFVTIFIALIKTCNNSPEITINNNEIILDSISRDSILSENDSI